MFSNDFLTEAIPIGTRLVDQVAWFNPRTWYSWYQVVAGFLEKETQIATQSLVGSFLPVVTMLILHYLAYLLEPQQLTTGSSLKSSAMRAVGACILSPWTMQCIKDFRSSITRPARLVAKMMTQKASTLPEADRILEEQIRDGRAERHRRYDVYLPVMESNTNSIATKALIFIPGALVERIAYSRVAKYLSNHGFVVAVVSIEPTQYPDFLREKEVRRIQSQVERSLSKKVKPKPDTHRFEWSICGHSAGARRALEIGMKMEIEKIIMCGFPFFPLPDFEVLENNNESQRLLVIQGECDPLVSTLDDDGFRRETEKFERFSASLPSKAVQVVIPGASHKNFASYIPGFYASKGDDGYISVVYQHRQVADLTAKFISDE